MSHPLILKKSTVNSLSLEWKQFAGDTIYVLYMWENNNFEPIYTGKVCQYTVTDLIPGKYKFYVSTRSGDQKTSEISFYTKVPITDVIKANDLTFALQILDQDEQAISQVDSEGQTVLHLACAQKFENTLNESDAIKLVRKILSIPGVDVNARDKKKNTPLHIAIRNQAPYEVVQMLIQKGANVLASNYDLTTVIDKPGPSNWTCLHYAASMNTDPRIFQLLLKSGGSLLVIDQYTISPKMLVTRNAHPTAKYLREVAEDKYNFDVKFRAPDKGSSSNQKLVISGKFFSTIPQECKMDSESTIADLEKFAKKVYKGKYTTYSLNHKSPYIYMYRGVIVPYECALAVFKYKQGLKVCAENLNPKGFPRLIGISKISMIITHL